MWLCDDKLKEKTAHFRLQSASQKRTCLSSLLCLHDAIHPYHAVPILNLKPSWADIKVAKDGECNNDERHNSGKDPSYFNFPRGKEKRKRAPTSECIV